MAATSKTLGDLHEQVAKALSEQVQGYKEETDEGVKQVRPSPALLGAAIAFLKNNNITADVEGNAALKDLNEKLAARRSRRLPQAALDEAADNFARTVGAGILMQ